MMRFAKQVSGVLFCSALSLPLSLSAGCGGTSSTTDDAALATDDVDAADVTTYQSALVVETVDGATFVADPAAAAKAAAAVLTADMQPAGCAVADVTLSKAVYTFTNCSGPYGLAKVNGTLTASYTSTATTVTVTLTSTGLQVNNANLNLDGTITYTQNGSSKSLTYESGGSATGSRGTKLTVSGSYTVGWDTTTSCMNLDGSWTTTVDSIAWSTSATGYSRCSNACPAAGGELSFSGPKDTLTISYAGTSTATWASSDGRTGTITLACP